MRVPDQKMKLPFCLMYFKNTEFLFFFLDKTVQIQQNCVSVLEKIIKFIQKQVLKI